MCIAFGPINDVIVRLIWTPDIKTKIASMRNVQIKNRYNHYTISTRTHVYTYTVACVHGYEQINLNSTRI